MKFTALIVGLLVAGFVTSANAQQIDVKREVDLKVGQSMIIYGIRSDCGASEAPSWQRTESRLPPVSLGTFSDGGTGFTNSRRCGGPTPARAIRFTATTRGSEVIEITGDKIDITVR